MQRELYKERIKIAHLDDLLPSLFRRWCLTIDMGQNLSLPNLEANQAGDTYYMSPLSCFVFGVVDNARREEHGHSERMTAYVWLEYDADRGSNQIASCL